MSRGAAVGAVVLCAGASTRMGEPKALAELAGETFLARIVRTLAAAGTAPPVVVTAAPHETVIRAEAAGLPVRWVHNPSPGRGMLSSIQLGLAAQPGECAGALIWPVDVPLVELSTVQALLAAAAGELLVPTWQGRGGHPLFVPARLFAEALALSESESLRTLRERHALRRIEVSDAGVVRDFDTPAELSAERESRQTK